MTQAAASPAHSPAVATPRPCLVSGVAIRRISPAVTDILDSTQSVGAVENSLKSEVQVLNQVNQALSDEPVMEIITSEAEAVSPAACDGQAETHGPQMSPFIPYLLVHDIVNPKLKPESNGEKLRSGKSRKSTGPYKVCASVQSPPKSFLSQSLENGGPLEDPDVQIVGVTPPQTTSQLTNVPLSLASCVSKTIGSSNTSSNNNVDVPLGESLGVGSTTQEGTSSSLGSSDTKISPLADWTRDKEGRVVQCIPLPSQVDSSQYVSSITPTQDGKFIIVVTAPKSLDPIVDLVCNGASTSSASCDHKISPGNEASTSFQTSSGVVDNDSDATTKSSSGHSSGGCILIYRVLCDSGLVVLDETASRVFRLDNLSEAVIALSLLPREISSLSEEEERLSSPLTDSEDSITATEVLGLAVLVSQAGIVTIRQLDDFKVMATILPPDPADKFVAATFCSGMLQWESGRIIVV